MGAILTSKLYYDFFKRNTYQIHAKHSAFDASQRDDSAHIFKNFETQKFGELWVKRLSKLGPGGPSAEWPVVYGGPSENIVCRIRSHQNTFRHHFWWLYIRMCPKNYPKKFRVILHIWWPEMSNFGFSSQNDQFEREREKWLWVGENHSIDPTDHTSGDKKLFFRVAPRKLIRISPKKNSWWSEVGQVDFGDFGIFTHICTDHLAPKRKKSENTKSDLQSQPLGPRCSLMAQNVRNSPGKHPCKFGDVKKF